MDIAITKGRARDRVEIVRADGSRAFAEVPHKGPVPHDAVHYFVEYGLGLSHGFWGMLATGHDPENLATLAREAGHASAARAGVPDQAIVALLQAERLVECFEADLWAGSGDNGALIAMAQSGWQASNVAPLVVDEGALDAVRDALAEFACEWMDAPEEHVARFIWRL